MENLLLEKRQGRQGVCAGIVLFGFMFLLVSAFPVLSKPNIVYILCDDWGYGDMRCNIPADSLAKHPEVQTPNVDSLAKKGIRCTDAHSNGVTCSPSRAALMTGRYPARYGIHESEDTRGGLDTAEILLPKLLKTAGYVSAAHGKWHLGLTVQFNPLSRGFDEFYGFMGHGGHSYLDLKNTDPYLWYSYMMKNYTPTPDTGYLTDRIADRSVDFIKRNKSRPFFLYTSFNAVHTPMEVPKTGPNSVVNGNTTRDTLMAMLRQMDSNIGRILKALDDNNLRDSTLVIISSDNGGASGTGAYNGPIRAFKGQTWEGGHRVPFIISYPPKLSKGTVYEGTIMLMDVLPTVCALVGIPLPKDRTYDGVNLLPYLTNQKTSAPHSILFWDEEGDWAVRRGDMKLNFDFKSGVAQLSNLKLDLREKTDLSAANLKLVDTLRNSYNAWLASMPPALSQTSVPGCLDPRYKEYNPNVNRPDMARCVTLLQIPGCMDEENDCFDWRATVNDPNACCKTGVYNEESKRAMPVFEKSFTLRAGNDGVFVTILKNAKHTITITDMAGRTVLRQSGKGLKSYAFNQLKASSGVFLVSVKIGGSLYSKTIILK